MLDLIKEVRIKLNDIFRKVAEGKEVIMEGRDIGTYVFPNADVKIYLDATPEERARRRVKQNEELGIKDTYEDILKNIKTRDSIDKGREMGALKQAEDAIYIDSSNMSIEKVVEEVAKDYPEVTLEHMLVDNCAMQLVRDPKQFDVILTENMFGDILSDEASMVTGSIGMLSSASLNETKFGLYEPSHGSAPDIAGQDKANPIATILSAAMMLRFSLDMDKEADAVEAAVQKVLTEGYRTGDIMSEGCKLVGTKEMGDLIAAAL